MDIHTTTGTIPKQIQIEELSREASITKFMATVSKAIAEGRLVDTPYGALLVKLGFKPFRDKLKEYLDAPLSSHYIKQRNLLLLITNDVDVLAYEVLTSVISMMGSSNRSLTQLSTTIMKKLFDNYVYGRIKEDNPKLHSYLGYEFKRATARKRRELIDKNIQSLYDEYSRPEAALRLQVGTLLINLLDLSGANVVKIDKQIVSNSPLRTSFMLSFTEDAMTIMESIDMSEVAIRTAERAPCVVPPKDWVSNTDGGYYIFRDKLVNFGNSPTTRDFQKGQTYDNIFPIINKLQSVPWRVNPRMLNLIDEVFTKNLPLGKLPSSIAKTWKDFMVMPPYVEKDKHIWAAANRKRQQLSIELDSEFSKRMMLMFSIGTARQMLKYKQFYYSYQLDYRGRVYPTSTHLNLLGTSEIKAMIEFGEGQYLTPDGLRWLKVHIANVYGLDKEPYDDRVQWVDNNYNMVLKVASEPLEQLSFLSEADSPFEFIAACMAFDDHMCGRAVHIPIQLDATCSGIQMYSGLLRDKVGAKSVNVIGSVRNDIYQQVADNVEGMLIRNEYEPIISYTDSEGKLFSVLADATASSLRGNVSRKIVKRPTMTVPYSVTMRGMREQIDEELLELENNGKKFWVGERWMADKILTSLVSVSIYSILDGAKKGQEYLVKLSQTLDAPAIWYSPIYDFPVHQNTIEHNVKRIITVYGALTLRMEGSKHNRRRQSNQIAPNFIHSIDSTVLLGVVEEANGLIGCIHDCFLVPPNSGYEVQGDYKKSYVEVMETDPLRRIQQQLDPEELVEFPEYGDLDLNEVYDAQYIIS